MHRRGLARPVRLLRGRTDLVDEVVERLRTHGGLVTLVGPTGVGKTHTATVIADRWRPRPQVEVD
ncbi:MAG: hypothetical protein AAF211_29570, partial [Myxococcota bacterium]